MKWLVVEAALALLRTLRRLAVRGHLHAGRTEVQLQQFQKREDEPMASVVILKVWKLEHYPPVQWPELEPLVAWQKEAQFLALPPTSSELPPDPTNP